MSTGVDERTTVDGDGPLKRTMGRKLLLLFIIGDILGAGIYALTGEVAGEVGGALWIPFVIAFVVAALTAASYAELVGKYPKAAGAALYTNKAFGRPFVTFMVAFAVMCSGITSASTAARAFGGDYLAEFVSLPVVLVALLFLTVIAVVNFRGVGESVKANVVLTIIEVTGLLVIIAIGVTAVLSGDGDPSRLTDIDTGEDGVVLGLLGGAALAFFALLGFEDSVNMAEEVHEPTRNYPRALFLGLGVTGVIYVLVALTCSLLVPPEKLEESSGPLLEVVEAGGLSFPAEAVRADRPRRGHQHRADQHADGVPAGLRHVARGHRAEAARPGARSPAYAVRAIVFTTLLGFGLVSTSKVEDLGDTTALLLLCVFAVVNVAVLVLRREPSSTSTSAPRRCCPCSASSPAWCSRRRSSAGRRAST